MTTRIRTLVIANRGEIAVRIARTCRAMGITTVGVYSDADADALHVSACDQAVRIGGDTPATSYLRGEAILAAAERTGADAVHPGFGFLAENADFARSVLDAGLTWVGPAPDVIAAMGDKIEAKQRMADAGVPLLPSATLDADNDVASVAAEIGFPLIVKAAAGGGGKGMRVVHDPDGLTDAVTAARREAASAFGDDRVFLERYVTAPRHVEVQVFGDDHGTVLHLLERECSIQRRHQKVVEETPSTRLDDALRDAVCQAAVQAAKAIGYTNAGTVEFVLDDTTGEFAFLEVNTRLQVEHPVTEAVTGLDLVRWQLLVAQGQPLPLSQDQVVADGHAIEVRLYAEDPTSDYLPAAGLVTGFVPADLPGVRWDVGVTQGSRVTPFYDPMVAKVIGHAPTRDEAAALLARALETSVVQGPVTNRDLLVSILRDEAFLAGDTTTAFLSERFADPTSRMRPPSPRHADLAAVVVVVHEWLQAAADATVLTTVRRGFSTTGLGPAPTTLVVAGAERVATIATTRDALEVVLDPDTDHATTVPVGDATLAGDVVTAEIDGLRLTARVHVDGDRVQVVLPDANVTMYRTPRFPQVGTDQDPGASHSPMPGTVVEVAVSEGEAVVVGDLLVVVEAMKMEHRITAVVDGTVSQVRVAAGTQVDADDVLVVVDAGQDNG